jgi:hypothetical protein
MVLPRWLAQCHILGMHPLAELITSIFTVFIAACAFIYSIWSGRKQQQFNRSSREAQQHHDKLSVRPVIEIYEESDGLWILNTGLGPAELVCIEVSLYGSEKYMLSDPDGRKRYAERVGVTVPRINSGTHFLPGKPCNLIPPSTEPGKTTHTKGLEIRVDYQSNYADGVKSYTYVSDCRLLKEREEDSPRKKFSA